MWNAGSPRSAMGYVEKHLIEGEQIVYKTRLHWIVLIVPVLLGLLFGIAGVALLVRSAAGNTDTHTESQAMAAGGAILLVIALILFGRGILKRNSTQMTVTNMRVLANVGIASRRSIEIFLSRVESIGVEEPVMGRMLGYGTVVVRGVGGTPESFNLIAHPLEFRTHVQQEIEKSQTK
jgi:uncharacterized membrane protein YdbT with pleckstrin-like domain